MLPPWKSLLLGLYYGGTWPWRRWQRAVAERAGECPAMVVYYHRVADDAANEWTVSNELFARQIAWLAENFDLVSLEEAQHRLRRGANFRPCVSITFDDGYADNCRHALPLLVDRRIPCTYFVSNQQVCDGLPFPHDRAAGQRFAPNSIPELRKLAALGIEIGAHTRTHCGLAKISDPARLLDEVVIAGEELQAAVGKPIRYFAFPYGQHANLNADVFHLAYEAGYEGVCSAYGGFNFPGDDAFHLQRFPADYSFLRLKNWATVDPRKLGLPRFEYESHIRRRQPQKASQR
jgi:peptidoglycan/xylan/chitin deacetylase (PgdA/CDA1 family)